MGKGSTTETPVRHKDGLKTSLTIFFFFFFENAQSLGRSDDAKRRKKRGWALADCFSRCLNSVIKRLPSMLLTSNRNGSSAPCNYLYKQSALNVQSKAFSRVGVKIWNGIPTSVKNVFRRSFKKYIS